MPQIFFHSLILFLFFSLLLAFAQEKKPLKAIRIGIAQIASTPDFDADARGFEKALGEAGFKEGVHVTYDRQNAQGDMANAQTIAQKFFDGKVDLIHSIATPTSQAVVRKIKDIPIIFSSVTDPVDAGLVPKTSSLGTKTGTNVTGVSDRWPVFLQFQMYTRFFPKARRWGTIYNAGDSISMSHIKEMREASKKLGVELIETAISSGSETLQATQSLAPKVQAFHITFDPTVITSFDAIVRVCNERKVPLFTGDVKGVSRGAMAAYVLDYFQVGYTAGKKAAQILKGEKPGDIPWESSEKLVLIINEKAAKAQGVIVSSEFLKKADRVITE